MAILHDWINEQGNGAPASGESKAEKHVIVTRTEVSTMNRAFDIDALRAVAGIE
ncbi:hypothetical protein [Modicisalibacter radicis]|uniref:hypothetical protein n=1 Tax=Halomonas sp. EAR18 TaxID=2518972 RepID=UPI001B34A614|nr:hypothetical protein [Halomonas sp. EAR18]